MGHTLAQWVDRVRTFTRDDGFESQVEEFEFLNLAIQPALTRFSIDRPYETVTEVAGAASSYLDMPAGWVHGFSRMLGVEYPARQNPPNRLDEQAFVITRSTTDVTAYKVLLLSATPAATEYVRWRFTLPWPTPTTTASDDKVDDVAYEAVLNLACSFVYEGLQGDAARARMASVLSPEYVDHEERSRQLAIAADRRRAIYEAYLGLQPSTSGGPAVAVASRRVDFDPYKHSLFHGGRS